MTTIIPIATPTFGNKFKKASDKFENSWLGHQFYTNTKAYKECQQIIENSNTT